MRWTDVNLPFPYFYNKEQYNGILLDWPDCCKSCKSLTCLNAKSQDLLECGYGINYQKVSSELTIAGFIVEGTTNSVQKSKAQKKYKANKISKYQLSKLQDNLHVFQEELSKIIEVEKQQIIDNYLQSEQYKNDFLLQFKDEIDKGLSFLHDYKQINSQISQNINVIIEGKYSGKSIEAKLSQASTEEQAIYWASKFLNVKLNTARFLIHSEWINMESEKLWFRFHGAFLKYFRIFENFFKQKNIAITMNSRSYKEIYANPEAVNVIIQTLLDNARKYSLKNSRIEIIVHDTNDGIKFSVGSYGPKIHEHEREKIFNAFYRGQEAEKQQEEGAGYGLYLSQLIAKSMGSTILCTQKEEITDRGTYWTVFEINILAPSRSI